MEEEKKNIEFEEPKEEEAKFAFRDLIDGNVLNRGFVVRQRRFMLLLVLIAFLSIANRNHAEKMVIMGDRLQDEVKEVRAHSISVSSELMRVSRESEVIRMIRQNGMNLEESLDPPKKLYK
ncbi:MAG: FtsL-like putative cell division protein [Bacteroidota bacterium]